jgi:hypothetical protein
MTKRSAHHQRQTGSAVNRTLASAAASASVPHTMMRTRAVKTTASAAVMSHSQWVLHVLRSSVQGNARQPSKRYVVISMLTVSYKMNMLRPLCNAILCRSMSSIYR